jgi:hypothetical protein
MISNESYAPTHSQFDELRHAATTILPGSNPQNTGQQAKNGNLEKCQRTYLPEEYPEENLSLQIWPSA